MQTRHVVLLPLLLLALTTLVHLPPAHAAVLTVTRFDDPVPDGACGPGQQDNDCSLREAVLDANKTPAEDTIVLAAGMYALGTVPETKGAGEDFGLKGDLDIRGNLIIRGAGPNATAINANYVDRVLDIVCPQACDVELHKLAVRRGLVNGWGGAIQVNGSGSRLYAADIKIIESWSIGAHAGGAVENDGFTHLVRANVFNNHAYAGAGVANFGTLSINDSFIGYNQANHIGGGVYNAGGREAFIDNSTIARNVATNCGGGIMTNGAATIRNSTIVRNVALAGLGSRGCKAGGGIDWTNHIYTRLRNTIVAFNADRDCGGKPPAPGGPGLDSQGYNLDSDATCGLKHATDLPKTNPLLCCFGFGGGPTFVYQLAKASPAIDSGDPVSCPARDQRGIPRPQDGNGDKKPRCDRGAFERRPGAVP